MWTRTDCKLCVANPLSRPFLTTNNSDLFPKAGRRVTQYFFNRYTAIAIAVQIIACIATWSVAFAVSPAGDRFFGLLFYFYLPAIFLVSTVLGLTGESGMIAGGVFGMLFGILLYGFIFGFAISFLRRSKSR